MQKKTSVATLAASALFASALPGQASAFTQCGVNVSNVYAGDGGWVWIYYTNGGSAQVSPNSVDKQVFFSLAMAAISGGRSVTVRYSADGVTCGAVGRTDLVGMLLN